MKDDLLVQRKIRRPRRLRARRPPTLHIAEILAWADAWFERTGNWPQQDSGHIPGTVHEKWANVDAALQKGSRGLPGGSSLARLLAEYRGKRNRKQLPPLSVAEILTWIDAHHARTGQWPNQKTGAIPEAPGETWMAVQMALGKGLRGLPGGSSLGRLLVRRRRVRIHGMLPRLSIEQILVWIDAHHRRTGLWPTAGSGPIHESPEENWRMIDKVLRAGGRGLPGRSSLARLLSNRRGVMMKHRRRPPLTMERILRWADAHHRRTGAWPRLTSGRIPEAPGETWGKINEALRKGERGLPGGATLAGMLFEYRGVRNVQGLPRLTIEQILAWADAHYARTGRWPTRLSGPIPGARGETWSGVNVALSHGKRGLPGGSSLPRLLAEHRGVPNRLAMSPVSVEQILAWADAYFERTGRWPNTRSGPLFELRGVTWFAVDKWLRIGRRGLPGGSSLRRLLQAHGRIAAVNQRSEVRNSVGGGLAGRSEVRGRNGREARRSRKPRAK
ncbi:MAG: hypothetical protein WD847_09020 [Pirellulales bacterium]